MQSCTVYSFCVRPISPRTLYFRFIHVQKAIVGHWIYSKKAQFTKNKYTEIQNWLALKVRVHIY